MSDPSYLRLAATGELEARARALTEELRSCALCPRECAADRADPRLAFCGVGLKALVSSAQPHFGEEPPITGTRGSGTIFFAGCNLRCWFCQNADISHGRAGRPVDAGHLAALMLHLQSLGCHNINLVTPTHVVPQILAALVLAVEGGLSIPLVYNSGGYDSIRTLRLLEGVVDIYMPDLKYADPGSARRLSAAPDYPEAARAALKEMYRQVGDLLTDSEGVAVKGLLVRHLVLPGDQAGTLECMRFLARELSPGTCVNIMAQYRPLYKSWRRSEVDRSLRAEEYETALEAARQAGIRRLVR
ncbi:radical SAM protein [Candidatus Zixiibacteriota bacterium]